MSPSPPGAGLIPTRFLILIAHGVITTVLLWSYEDNLLASLPESNYSYSDYESLQTELRAGLYSTLALLLLEMAGFITGFSMFYPMLSLCSCIVHAVAVFATTLFIYDKWDSELFWVIFTFGSCLPALLEIGAVILRVFVKK